MTFTGYLEGYGVLASKGISTTIALADIGRCIYSTQQAHELTDEAGIDIGDDFAQVLFWYKYLAIGNLKQDKRFMDPQGAIAQVCYAIVYASLSVVTSLEFLNGSGAPDTGSEFTADSNQSTFASIHDNELARTEAGTSCGTWSSVAAECYTEANQALQGFTREIAAADAARVPEKSVRSSLTSGFIAV